MPTDKTAALPKRPYLLRALHQWITDTGQTPHVVVAADQPGVQVPTQFVEDGKVILNTASLADLDRLPGVGKKTAERILELRTRLGRFKKLQDLLRVKGIGTKSLQKMMPLLVLDPP